MGNSLELESWHGELVSQQNYERALGKSELRSALLLWVTCGFWAVTGWPSRTSYWGCFPETASWPLRHWAEHRLYIIKCFSALSNETSIVLTNRSTSHILIEKCFSILGAQGMSRVPAYLELVDSQFHMSCRCFLSACAVLSDVRKVSWLFATDGLLRHTILSHSWVCNKHKIRWKHTKLVLKN